MMESTTPPSQHANMGDGVVKEDATGKSKDGVVKEDKKSKDVANTNLLQEDDDVGSPKRDRRHAVLESLGLIMGKTLGHGSYASVKSSYDIKRKEKVAIKIVSRRRAPEDYLKKFLPREIEVLKLLRHSCIVKFYQVIETTNRFYIVMEIAENGDLLDAIRQRVYIDESLAREWFKQIHDGISYIHSKGVAHRDVKCENILLDKTNSIKITDFGFAKRNFPLRKGESIYSETFCGSYAYAPPEILKGIPYDPFIAEIWSMGVVLFTMVFGRLPYDDSDLKRLLKQVQTKVVFPSKPSVTEDCKRVIGKMLVHHRDRIGLADMMMMETWFKVQMPGSSHQQAKASSDEATTSEA